MFCERIQNKETAAKRGHPSTDCSIHRVRRDTDIFPIVIALWFGIPPLFPFTCSNLIWIWVPKSNKRC